MESVTSISDLPEIPAVYALYGGQGRNIFTAYVGVAGHLKRRIKQHLENRDSSVATGTSAVGLNPDYVTEVRWWEHPSFTDRAYLEAAEIVAFDILDPALRSRSASQEAARTLAVDAEFVSEMRGLFNQEPNGHLIIPTFQDALKRLSELERRVAALEQLLRYQTEGHQSSKGSDR